VTRKEGRKNWRRNKKEVMENKKELREENETDAEV
jgi:hypothetical protein